MLFQKILILVDSKQISVVCKSEKQKEKKNSPHFVNSSFFHFLCFHKNEKILSFGSLISSDKGETL